MVKHWRNVFTFAFYLEPNLLRNENRSGTFYSLFCLWIFDPRKNLEPTESITFMVPGTGTTNYASQLTGSYANYIKSSRTVAIYKDGGSGTNDVSLTYAPSEFHGYCFIVIWANLTCLKLIADRLDWLEVREKNTDIKKHSTHWWNESFKINFFKISGIGGLNKESINSVTHSLSQNIQPLGYPINHSIGPKSILLSHSND